MPDIVISDDKLVTDMRRGDETALERIIDRYTAYVGTIVWNIVGERLDKADAKEVVSEVFYTLWQNAGRIQPGRLKSYLSKIARSRAVDALRRLRQEMPLEDDLVQIPIKGPESDVIREEEYAALRQALEEMPEPDRTIFIRHYYSYQKTSHIAQAMGINVNTVQSKLRRGRERLRRKLTEGGYFIG